MSGLLCPRHPDIVPKLEAAWLARCDAVAGIARGERRICTGGRRIELGDVALLAADGDDESHGGRGIVEDTLLKIGLDCVAAAGEHVEGRAERNRVAAVGGAERMPVVSAAAGADGVASIVAPCGLL